MTQTKLQLHKRISIPLILASLVATSSAYADDYRDARAEMVAAYQQQDFAAMRAAAKKALAIRPENPGAKFNLAMAEALSGDSKASLQTLNELLRQKADFGADALPQFVAVAELTDWPDYLARLETLRQPIGHAEVHAQYGDTDFVPEGIALDADGSVLLGSIRRGQLVQLGARSTILSERDSHWSVFGMRLHSDGSLWFASAAVPQIEGNAADSGSTGLFRFDRNEGVITKAAILPPYEPTQVLGDLVIADANTIYTSDSRTGAIYRYYIDSNEFEILVQRGKLTSPQGLVVDKTGEYLYVADYSVGLFRVALSDGSLLKLALASDSNDYGIDGLYRHGDKLIAIQNGVRPHRVAALQLDEAGLTIESSEILAANLEWFDEPTLGSVVGDEFYFVANSHWNRFDSENQLPDGLSGPIVLRLSLR